ncbi:MAG: N-6 DNA methylase [Acidobacteriota bacterium]
MWLSRTFNGDLLPLSERIAPQNGSWFPTLSEAEMETVTSTLTKILHRTEPSGQMRLDWGDIDFAHVPVGLLSQVYERHNQIHDPISRKRSVFYTPRTLAEYMVDEAFAALDTPHMARVLDPAAGAGVFLVAAFRKLVEARWRRDGKRPTTKIIRAILNSQLAGFEINESALRLSALSLYLTALELDPSPRPLDALKFDDLRGKVLFDVAQGESGTYIRGSLGSSVGKEHDGHYDLVIGNPPWTALKVEAEHMKAVVAVIRPIISDRLGQEYATRYRLPDGAPDIAFFWRSLQWAKPKGQIAFAMHGRLLFKQSAVGRAARKDVLSAATVTGILNGAALRLTEIWPKVSAPFCLVFARNERSTASDAFYFVSPEREDAMNQRGRLRIDAKAARVVGTREAIENPFLLKTLFRGTPLDIAVMEKLVGGRVSVADYWRSHKLACGNGYLVGGPAGKKVDATQFQGRAVLTAKSQLKGFAIDNAHLDTFKRATLERSRDERIYEAPLVLINAAPAADRATPRAWISLKRNLLFTESFVSYSCGGHEDPYRLAKYLFLLFNSSLWSYFALLTSSKFGVERDAVLNEDIDRFPFEPLESLSKRDHSRVDTLYDAIISGKGSWSAVDLWASALYGLNTWDREVIADTLAVSSPYVSNQKAAQRKPAGNTIQRFVERVVAELQAFVPRQLSTDIAQSEPWTWFYVGCSASPSARGANGKEFTKHADYLGATQILSVGNDGVRVGLLGQSRYWTSTRARLLALDLIEQEALLQALQCE